MRNLNAISLPEITFDDAVFNAKDDRNRVALTFAAMLISILSVVYFSKNIHSKTHAGLFS